MLEERKMDIDEQIDVYLEFYVYMCVCALFVCPPQKKSKMFCLYELRKSSLSNLSIDRIGLFGPT